MKGLPPLSVAKLSCRDPLLISPVLCPANVTAVWTPPLLFGVAVIWSAGPKALFTFDVLRWKSLGVKPLTIRLSDEWKFWIRSLTVWVVLESTMIVSCPMPPTTTFDPPPAFSKLLPANDDNVSLPAPEWMNTPAVKAVMFRLSGLRSMNSLTTPGAGPGYGAPAVRNAIFDDSSTTWKLSPL